MKKLLVLVVVFSLLLFACHVNIPDKPQELQGNFWAQNFKDGKFYRVDAEKIWEGTYCTVWAETGSGINEVQARQIADEYDKKIYGKMINAFGFTSITVNSNVHVINTMEYADSLSKNPDGKLCILLLDIKDNYKKDVNKSYVAGYFWAGNFYNGSYSNYCDMIYIDTDPGFKDDKENAYNTLAHEMQHLMNFVSSVVYGRSSTMDIWIDEGLSSAAEWIYQEKHPGIRWQWYNNLYTEKGLIDKGNNFFVWGNRETENIYASLDDYATVYLFFQWLRLQTGSTNIYKTIITSSYSDYRAVTNAINTAIPGQDSSWETLLKTWLAANRINAGSGAYGYMNDSVLKQIKAPVAPSGQTNIMLYPGEGVYSATTTAPSLTPSGFIKYVYLTNIQPQDSFAAGSFLLTYNVNTNKAGAGEQGTITGASIAPSMLRGAAQQSFDGPFPISAGDMLRRNGKNGDFSEGVNLKLPDAYRGIIVNE